MIIGNTVFCDYRWMYFMEATKREVSMAHTFRTLNYRRDEGRGSRDTYERVPSGRVNMDIETEIDNDKKPYYQASNDILSQYKDKVIGSGQCVDLVKKATGAPATSLWKEGENVKNNWMTIPTGTAIATFVNGKYPNGKTGNHAAIFLRGDTGGIWVLDQWKGHVSSERYIKFESGSSSASNDASKYSVIR